MGVAHNGKDSQRFRFTYHLGSEWHICLDLLVEFFVGLRASAHGFDTSLAVPDWTDLYSFQEALRGTVQEIESLPVKSYSVNSILPGFASCCTRS